VKTGSGSVTGGGQTCSISQTGTGSAANMAGIYENSNKVSGLTQSQQYVASITQTSSGSGNNTACVTQAVGQDGSTSNTNTKGVTVSLGAIQSITITQNTLTGNNTATNGANPTTGNCTGVTLTQSQTQTSTVSTNGNISQTLNPAVNSTITNGGNASLDIEQNQANGVKGSASGTNSAVFSQTTNQTLIANTKNGATVTQKENQPDGDGTTGHPFSGIVGTVNQDSKGQSRATVTQSETQCEDAANTSNSGALTGCSTATNEATPTGLTSLTQTENGPVGLLTPANSGGPIHAYHKGIGTSAQTGAVGVADSFILNQTSSQYSDKPGPGVTVNQLNTMQGDCASSGNGSPTGGSCAFNQAATLNSANNSGTTSDGYTAGSISQLLIKCDNGHASCTATPPPAPTSVTGPTSPNPSSSAAFSWHEAASNGVSFLCSIDGGTPVSCQSGVAFFQGYGAHTFQVAATDAFTNASAFVPSTGLSFTNVPPDPTITSGPDQPNSTSRDASFTFSDPDSTIVDFFCKLDNASSYTACPSTTPMYSGLSLGSHTLDVKAASDSTGQYLSNGNAEYQWTVIPYLTFEASSDGASGWSNGAGSPIDLTTGSDVPNTFAQITLHNFEGVPLSDLVDSPSFTTDNYAAGSPRFVIDLSNGDSLWGYPPNSGLNGTDFAWAINNGNSYLPWSDVQTAEAGTTIEDAVVVADGDQPTTTDVITGLTFDGYTFN
jgi:hypothetical protein